MTPAERYAEARSARLVLGDIFCERMAQVDKWGQQNLPDLGDSPAANAAARTMFDRYAIGYKAANAAAVDAGNIDWTGVLLEEVYEALAEEDTALLRAELVQVAAVAVAWVEAIDRRTS